MSSTSPPPPTAGEAAAAAASTNSNNSLPPPATEEGRDALDVAAGVVVANESAMNLVVAEEDVSPTDNPPDDNNDNDNSNILVTAATTAQVNAAVAAAAAAAAAAASSTTATETAATNAALLLAPTTTPAAKRRKVAGSDHPPPPAIPSTVRTSWEERLKQLQDYKNEHGHLYIPIRFKENPSLGKFVHNTREQYKLYHHQTPQGYKKKCSLTAERIAQLDALGFVWSTQRAKAQDDEWHRRYEQLKEYHAQKGHCQVPHGYTPDPSLAEWVHRQRTNFQDYHNQKKGKMHPKWPERQKLLEDIGFRFTVHSHKWMEHWTALQEYHKEHGNSDVPTHYAPNPRLGRWVHTQRHQKRLMDKGRKSSMTPERVQLLDQLHFSWEVRPALDRPRVAWKQRLRELQAYKEEHGHILVPPETHPSLYAWLVEQQGRLSSMNATRLSALTELGLTKDVSLPPAPPPPAANTAKNGTTDESAPADTADVTSQEPSDTTTMDSLPMPEIPVGAVEEAPFVSL